MTARTVWKFPLELASEQLIEIPGDDPKVLHIGEQYGSMTTWIEVNPEAKTAPCRIYMVGTGRPIPENAGVFLGTVPSGPFVWHFYSPHVSAALEWLRA